MRLPVIIIFLLNCFSNLQFEAHSFQAFSPIRFRYYHNSRKRTHHFRRSLSQQGQEENLEYKKKSSNLTWRYNITRQFTPYRFENKTATKNDDKIKVCSKSDPILLPQALVNLDYQSFPTLSQARKAARHGEVIIFRQQQHNQYDDQCHNDHANTDVTLHIDMIENMKNFTRSNTFALIGTATTQVERNDIIAIQTRLPDSFYPQSRTGYVYPPPYVRNTVNCIEKNHTLLLPSVQVEVIYEDDNIAVINKPENLTTIGTSENKRKSSHVRDDLLSCLPFLLQPPNTPQVASGPKHETLSTPRPIHRLDRKTSGLVLVAKTLTALTDLSKNFANRSVKKSYMALVLDQTGITTSEQQNQEIKNLWNVIDYPIDGKNAVTKWRLVANTTEYVSTSNSTSYYTLSLLEIRPETGRFHQIRRHLSYCLGCPIVGDAKYDRGSKLAKSLRRNGMFLCSNSIEFPYPAIKISKKNFVDLTNNYAMNGDRNEEYVRLIGNKENYAIHANIPLPEKFWKMVKNG